MLAMKYNSAKNKDGKRPGTVVPDFLRTMAASTNPKVSPPIEAKKVKVFDSSEARTRHSLVRMATIGPEEGGNTDLQAVAFWLENEDGSKKPIWQCKLFYDQVMSRHQFIMDFGIQPRMFGLWLNNIQVNNSKGWPFRLYVRFCPAKLSLDELYQFAHCIANQMNRNPEATEAQSVKVRITDDPDDENNFIIKAHTNSVWSTVLGEHQAYKHLAFYNPSMTGPEWSKTNMDIVRNYFIPGELGVDTATELGLPMHWVKPSERLLQDEVEVEVVEVQQPTKPTQMSQMPQNSGQDSDNDSEDSDDDSA